MPPCAYEGGGGRRDYERGDHGDAIGGGGGDGYFFFNDTATTEIYTLSLHDALPISDLRPGGEESGHHGRGDRRFRTGVHGAIPGGSERRCQRGDRQRDRHGADSGQRHADAVDQRRDGGGGGRRDDERGVHGDAVGGGGGYGDGEVCHAKQQRGQGRGLHGQDGDADVCAWQHDADRRGGGRGRSGRRV